MHTCRMFTAHGLGVNQSISKCFILSVHSNVILGPPPPLSKERERDRERQRETERETQTDRQTDRQRQRERERERQRQRQGQTERDRQTERGREMEAEKRVKTSAKEDYELTMKEACLESRPERLNSLSPDVPGQGRGHSPGKGRYTSQGSLAV